MNKNTESDKLKMIEAIKIIEQVSNKLDEICFKNKGVTWRKQKTQNKKTKRNTGVEYELV